MRLALEADMDWSYLQTLATSHGMLPLLYRAIQQSDAHPVLDAVSLEEDFLETARRNLQLTGDLLAILDRLAAIGVRALPYKGPTLAALAYGDVSDRRFVDLDVLIDPRDLQRAGAELEALGYDPEFRLDLRDRRLYIRSQSDLTFARREPISVVELQWGIAPPYFSFPIRFDELWARRQSVVLGGREAPTPGPDDLVILLCVHASKHLWERLAWISDVAHLIDRAAIDWDGVLQEARRRGALRMILLGLHLSRGLLGSSVPTEVRDAIRKDPGVRRLAQELAGSLFLPIREEPRLLSRSLLHVRMRERAWDRVLYVSRVVFRPNEADWRSVRLPVFLHPAYYAMRPIRIAIDSFRRAVGSG